MNPGIHARFRPFLVALDDCYLLFRVPGIFPGMASTGPSDAGVVRGLGGGSEH